MHKAVAVLCEKLDEVAAGLAAFDLPEQRLSQSHSWTSPAISPAQLANLPSRVAMTLRQANISSVSETDEKALDDAVNALTGLISDVFPNLPGDTPSALPPILTTLSYVSMIVEPLYSWSAAVPIRMPGQMMRKLASIERDLNAIIPDKELLEQKVATILEAEGVANDLPATVQELKDANTHLRNITSSGSSLFGKIEEDQKKAAAYIADLHTAAEEGAKLVTQAGEAYRITTSIGLAAAFDDRAKTLNTSLKWWVFALAVALLVAMSVGIYRIEAMKEALVAPSLERVWVQVILSALSLGAPIWFAWIATKQISQRFRLAEDYAFKASVAKAYEGYRKEAHRIDHQLEKRLFSSALTRLDEAPLRLVETHTHGSPLHELANSRVVKSVVDTVAAFPSRLRSKGARLSSEPGAAE